MYERGVATVAGARGCILVAHPRPKMETPNQSRVAHAGAIVFRDTAAGPHVLLVRAKKTPNDWIFPKGHVETGETEAQTARRELCEEAGIEGEPLGPIGTSEFQSGDELVRVKYYLFRYSGEASPGEGRESRWCTVDEGLGLLAFESARDLLRTARRLWGEASS